MVWFAFVINFVTLVAGIVTITWFIRDVRKENSKVFKIMLEVQKDSQRILEKIEEGQRKGFQALEEGQRKGFQALEEGLRKGFQTLEEGLKYIADILMTLKSEKK